MRSCPRTSAAPPWSFSRTATPISRACSTPRSRSGRRSCCLTSAASARWQRRAPRGLSRRATRRRSRARCASSLPTSMSARSSASPQLAPPSDATPGTPLRSRRCPSTASCLTHNRAVLALAIVFWCSLGLLAYTHAGYPLVLGLLARMRRTAPLPDAPVEPPSVSLVVAAYDEEGVIEEKVRNVLALDYPRERLELIVASDGSDDRTADLARAAGADRVIELPRVGKAAAQDAAVENARGEIVAFSDANSLWAPDALRRLVAPLGDPSVGYVCGQVRFISDAGAANQEGTYWRYEMAVRSLESRLGGITAGNGAIYALRRFHYKPGDPYTGDLSLPFRMARRGLRSVYAAGALAEEPMVPTLEGEFRRKRRMMSRAFGTVLRGGMLNPRGYSPLFAFA